MNRASYHISHRLTRQSFGCRSKQQSPLRGRAAAVSGYSQPLIQRARCVAPKRAIVAVDVRGFDGAIATPIITDSIDDSSPLNSVVAPSTVNSPSVNSPSVNSPSVESPSVESAQEAQPTLPKSSLRQGISQFWIGWLLIALLLSMWFIAKTVMV